MKSRFPLGTGLDSCCSRNRPGCRSPGTGSQRRLSSRNQRRAANDDQPRGAASLLGQLRQPETRRQRASLTRGEVRPAGRPSTSLSLGCTASEAV
eukprot:CAMPEP_0180220026 /NCGR_PEP_ID=MMETSP0987-20121128/18875_1 /TAXON_ID=697907 /ORGANISM="non described non described, Strain CCMP2293" /LENGTH=94 /DNA_ID=CAMNT_0022180855 /DNA_START=140 /DNA_END=427 /DNA_ORIENTATION=-